MASSSSPSSRASSSSSSQRRRKTSESRAHKEEYTYALTDTSISEWLKCPICLNPFVEPMQAHSCEHVFCRECIHLHMAACKEKEQQGDAMGNIQRDVLCPTCRSSILSHQLRPAANLIRNMVDSLLVKCPHQNRGCSHTCERSLVLSHAKKECGWAYIGEYDEIAEGIVKVNRGKCDCGKRVLKREWPDHIIGGSCSIERFRCVYANKEDGGCHEMLCEGELKEHQDKCPARPIACPHCDTKLQQRQKEDHEMSCSKAPTTCPMRRFGCSWTDRREILDGEHKARCPFLPLEAFLTQQENVVQELRRDNARLATSISSLQEEQRRTLALVQRCMASLGPSFASTAPSIDFETGAEVTASNDVIVPLSTPPHLEQALPPSPPVTLRGRSGTTIDIPTTATRWDSAESINNNHASTSAPASRADFPWQWPEPAFPSTSSSSAIIAPNPLQSKTVSDLLAETDRKLSDMEGCLKQLDRRVEDIHVVGLNANFEASRAHEELNNVHHGLHALRISIIMQQQQQQRNMPGSSFLPGQGGPLSADGRASEAANLPNTGAPSNAMPYLPGPSASMMSLRRFWTGYEQTKL